ncbi:hypothetical protein STSP2_00964 [Anaerohalosphaera lusitana]|uniref:Uncharacterized protein n=1 Tax=Anaerohalosphaera lusitana TaxID=1936003 RepID=A0A1U9NJB0_9BACT|nr:hypothetical protein [Anaerohalosphaera lusitana]AQT67814.1 hypothetical protein STSP2_00964 [Anaerohalosphaera lusitana]
MVQFIARLTGNDFSKLGVSVELSNGTVCEARYTGDSIFRLKWRIDIEFELACENTKVDFKVISKNLFRTIYAAFDGKKEVLRLVSCIFSDYIIVNGKKERMAGVISTRVENLGFFGESHPFLIGSNYKGEFEDDHILHGTIVATYCVLKMSFTDSL